MHIEFFAMSVEGDIDYSATEIESGLSVGGYDFGDYERLVIRWPKKGEFIYPLDLKGVDIKRVSMSEVPISLVTRILGILEKSAAIHLDRKGPSKRVQPTH